MSDRPPCLLVTYDRTGITTEPTDHTRRPGLCSVRIEIDRKLTKQQIADLSRKMAKMLLAQLRTDGPKNGSNKGKRTP